MGKCSPPSLNASISTPSIRVGRGGRVTDRRRIDRRHKSSTEQNKEENKAEAGNHVKPRTRYAADVEA